MDDKDDHLVRAHDIARRSLGNDTTSPSPTLASTDEPVVGEDMTAADMIRLSNLLGCHMNGTNEPQCQGPCRYKFQKKTVIVIGQPPYPDLDEADGHCFWDADCGCVCQKK